MAPTIKLAFDDQRKKHHESLTAQLLEKERLKRQQETKKQREKETITKQLKEVRGLWTDNIHVHVLYMSNFNKSSQTKTSLFNVAFKEKI